MTSNDLNAILSEIRSAREADDTARALVFFAKIDRTLREELADFAGVEVDEDGMFEAEAVREAVKAICDLPASDLNAPIFAALHDLLLGASDNVVQTWSTGRWSLAFEADHLAHYATDEEINPNAYPATLVLGGEDAHWIEPCEAGDEAQLDAPTWDADEGTSDIVCAFPVNGKWVAWVQVR